MILEETKYSIQMSAKYAQANKTFSLNDVKWNLRTYKEVL